MIFEELAEYKKDFKKLLKKYRSLTDDISTIKQVLEIFPDDRAPFSYQLNNLGIESCVIKVKKIACKSLKGRGVNSGLRLIYAYFQNEEGDKIIFIELYHKSDKALEDRDRILKHFK